jgi:hypothetical protein
MINQKIQVTDISKFSGQFSDVDPSDAPEGAMVQQVNMMSVVNGTLTTRGGLKEVTLEVLE